MPDLLSQIPETRIVPAGRYGVDAAGVSVTIIEGARLASIVATRGQARALDTACRTAFGIPLPQEPKHAGTADVGFIGTGPGRWLAVSFAPADLEDRLRQAFASAAAICDQSDGYVLFDVSGARARDALAKGVALDLDPSAFRPGDAATSSAALIGVTLWQLDATPTFRLAVGRSFAASFSRLLVASAAEFGCTVASEAARQ